MEVALSSVKRRPVLMSALVLALSLASFPQFADARAGSGSSSGSRGSRTWSAPPPTRTSPYGAAPMERSIAPQQPMPGYGQNYGARPMGPGQMGAGTMMGRPRHPFLTGFAGGMLGAGLFGMLSGHGFMGGIHGLFGFLGLLIQIALVVLVARWLWSLFNRRRAGGGGLTPANGMGSRPTGNQRPLEISARDYQAFQQLLFNVQAAWSQQNIPALQGMATPEMVSYFNQQLATLASRGERNVVSDVRFLQGDLSEAWSENGYDYATVAMRYSLVDLTTDMTGRVVEGSSAEPVVVTELWTFVRPSSGGAWLLSAIQQTR